MVYRALTDPRSRKLKPRCVRVCMRKACMCDGMYDSFLPCVRCSRISAPAWPGGVSMGLLLAESCGYCNSFHQPVALPSLSAVVTKYQEVGPQKLCCIYTTCVCTRLLLLPVCGVLSAPSAVPGCWVDQPHEHHHQDWSSFLIFRCLGAKLCAINRSRLRI